MAFWLLVERLENWEVDRKEGFCRFGLPQSKKALADQIRTGDTLIFYVSSGISSFSGIREAASDGTSRLGIGGEYDTAFPLLITTKPKLTLDRGKWVPLRDLAGRLSITAGKPAWWRVMRRSLRRLDEKDAEIIISAMTV